MIPSRRAKAVGLFSGSLDSILATKLVTEQGIGVVALNFKLPFPIPGRVPTDEQLQMVAAMLGVNLVSVEAGEDYLDIIRAPQFGYTRGMAPCVDCVAYMLKKAGELMREIKADFVFTGEVLGQQPLSQSKRSLKILERLSGLEGRLLRPLSAKVLEPTMPELSGLVRRERLLDFHGQSRRRQIRLAREFGIVNYPIPGAGCLLRDANFAARCRDAIEHNEFRLSEVKLLRYGRHFRLPSEAKVVVGRNKEENCILEQLAKPGDVICRPTEVPGPVVLLRAKKKTKKDTEAVARICARYSDNVSGATVKVFCGDREISVRNLKDEAIMAWRIGAAEEMTLTQSGFQAERQK